MWPVRSTWWGFGLPLWSHSPLSPDLCSLYHSTPGLFELHAPGPLQPLGLSVCFSSAGLACRLLLTLPLSACPLPGSSSVPSGKAGITIPCFPNTLVFLDSACHTWNINNGWIFISPLRSVTGTGLLAVSLSVVSSVSSRGPGSVLTQYSGNICWKSGSKKIFLLFIMTGLKNRRLGS